MMEELFSDANIILMGFVVWLLIAPRIFRPNRTSSFPAYIVALLLCMTVTSDLGLRMPTAFFFCVGGGLAFCFLVGRVLWSSFYWVGKSE